MGDGSHLTATVRERAALAVLAGMPIVNVGVAYGVDRRTVSRWVARYRENGRAALCRKEGSGRPRKLEELTEHELRTKILRSGMAYGFETDLWTVNRLRRVIFDEFRIRLSKNTIWRRLRDAGLTYQKPEREYYEIDEATRKKWLRYEVPKIRRAVKKHRAILYFQDESNISLTAFLARTWGLRGQTPKAKVTGKRAGVAATSAISRNGQLLFRLLDRRIASKEVIEFLDQMLRHHLRRHLVVVMDQAPPHTSKNSLDRQPAATTRVLLAKILPRLESRRESMEPLETSRTCQPPGEEQGRVTQTRTTEVTVDGATPQPLARDILSMLRR